MLQRPLLPISNPQHPATLAYRQAPRCHITSATATSIAAASASHRGIFHTGGSKIEPKRIVESSFRPNCHLSDSKRNTGSVQGPHYPSAAVALDEVAVLTEPINPETMDFQSSDVPSEGGSEEFSVSPPTTLPSASSLAKPKRKRITGVQLDSLLALFAQSDTPSYEVREQAGRDLGMSNREVQVWFQNRRAKERALKQKQQLQEHQQRLAELPTGSSRSSSMASSGSPPLSTYSALPEHLVRGRRRSFSVNELERQDYGGPSRRTTLSPLSRPADFPETQPSYFPQPDARETGSLRSASSGPVRPRLARFASQTSPEETESGSRTVWSSGKPVLGRPRSGSATGIHQRPYARPYDSLPSPSRLSPQTSTVPLLPAPLPSPRYGTFSPPVFYPSLPSQTESLASQQSQESIAERRSNRLPPIKLLLDMADTSYIEQAAAQSPSSAHSLPPLSSPFARLGLASPLSQRTVYSDVSQTSYFDSHTPTQNTLSPPIPLQQQGALSQQPSTNTQYR